MKRRLAVLLALSGLLLGGGLAPAQASYVQTAAASWTPDGPVYAIAVTDTRIYLGGDFDTLTNPSSGSSVTRHGLAALDRATGAPLASWTPDADAAVRTLVVADDGTVYAGGDFTEVAGQARNGLAAIAADGAVASYWSPDTDGRVWDLRVSGNDLYVVGNFTHVEGVHQPGAVRVTRDTGAVDTSWNADVSGGRVQALALDGGTVYLAGTFSSLGGQARPFAGAVTAASGAVTPWAPAALCASCRIRDLTVDSGLVFAAVGGEPGGRAVAWSTTTAEPAWKASADGEVQAVAVRDGVAYFGGHFAVKFGGQLRSQLAAVDASTGAVSALKLTTTGSNLPGIWALDAQADALRIGGGTQLLDQPYARYLVLPDSATVPPRTTITLVLDGCATCRVKLSQAVAGSTDVWSTAWKHAVGGRVTVSVPTSRTVGMSIWVKAPWERRTKKTTEVVMRYGGQVTGTKVSSVRASTKHTASGCWLGTTRTAVTMKVSVRRANLPGAHGTARGSRAWVPVTRAYLPPMQKTKHGVLAVRVPTRCG